MDERQPQINMQHIPVGRSFGAGVLIAILLTGLFLDLPGIRTTAIGGAAIGLLIAAVLIVWRRRAIGRAPHPTLGILHS
jgi:hypothetical protein